VTSDERVFLLVSQLMKKSLWRVIGRQTRALIDLAGGCKQWPEYLRRLFCAGLAAVKNLRDLDVVTREPFCQPLNIGSPVPPEYSSALILLALFWLSR
jgi:hypothetical protein